ncbi:cyclic nucleotide-binding domain-containing protein [Butyrivibrio sp. XPD2002]|uniref:cyclic nucleotide-binding domain-containing protein n=1 Tax=Butyrivibrio sp. XPD2002 TaxID=1280665 RepID=UPI0018CB3AA5|nr:cyclic nucleotide-binding domain-containing protein [Butyrivibrio sp. XPD2002]
MTDKHTVITNLKGYEDGQVVFNEGDDSCCMYDVQKGKVGIFLNYGTDKQKKIAEIGAGRVFGEMGMVEGLPRSATAVSLSEFTVLAVITWETLSLYFKAKPSRVVQIMQHTSDRLRVTTKANSGLRASVEQTIEKIENGCSREDASKFLRKALENVEQAFAENK